jgi:hypothetical protein
VDNSTSNPKLWVRSNGQVPSGYRETKHTFNIQVKNSANSNVYYSNFHLYLYQCLMENCMNCTFGTVDTEVCYECQPGYDFNSDKSECNRMTVVDIMKWYLECTGYFLIIVGFISMFLGQAQTPAWIFVETM